MAPRNFSCSCEKALSFGFSSTAEEVTHGNDASDRTAVVTGASSGIGVETVRVLALRGAEVVLAVRIVEAGEKVKADILKSNNAGVMACPFAFSEDGMEMQFATNHVGHFLLTSLLLDNMKSTAKETSIQGRIVNVSSDGHQLWEYPGGIRFDKLNDKERRKESI